MKLSLLLLFSLSILPYTVFAQTSLSLENYVKQVREQNEAYKGLNAQNRSYELKEGEADLLTSPTLVSEIKTATDKSQDPFSTIALDKKEYQSMSIGVQQQNTIGTQFKISHQIAQYKLSGNGLPPGYDSFYLGTTALEVKQSLWKNFFGSETRKTQEAIRAGNKGQQFASSFQKKMLLVQAENLYWQLSLARDSIRIQSESLLQAKKIRDWASNRVTQNLTDRSEYLQADAGVKYRELGLKTATSDMKALERAFNKLRGSNQTQVPEKLILPTVDQLKIINIVNTPLRADTLALEQESLALKYKSAVNKESLSPTLDLAGQYVLNGFDQKMDETQKKSFKSDNSLTAISLSLSVPLDYFNRKKIDDGYSLDAKSAELNYSRKKFEAEQEWIDLVKRYEEATDLLNTARQLEKAQEEKLKFERTQLYRGKTVTFQVLTFEQEFLESALLRLKAESGVLAVLANMKIYEIN